MSVFLHRILTGQPITIWDDGGVVGDYLYVSDLVDALERAPEVEPRERVINIGSGRGVSLNELLQLIAGILGEQPEIEYFPARAVDVPTVVLDISRARTELGWRPKTKLSEGISRVRDWICTFQSMSEIIENAGEVAEEVVPVLRPPAKLRAKGDDNT